MKLVKINNKALNLVEHSSHYIPLNLENDGKPWTFTEISGHCGMGLLMHAQYVSELGHLKVITGFRV